MFGRRFSVAEVAEVLQHWQAGKSRRELARSLGMGRNRIDVIVAVAEAAGLTPGGPLLSRQEWERRVPELFAEQVVRPVTDPTKEIRRFHEVIVAGLTASTVTTVWQRLRDEQGLTASLSTFRRYVRRHVRRVRPEVATVRKEVTPLGEVAEVDYGRLGRWWDALNERWRRVWGFVMTLAFSRMIFVWPVLMCDETAWVAAHVAAFAFFGSVPRQIRLDNLKTGVLRPDIYDPLVNPATFGMAAMILSPTRHRDLVLAARVRRGGPILPAWPAPSLACFHDVAGLCDRNAPRARGSDEVVEEGCAFVTGT
jgi:hypothetical protein